MEEEKKSKNILSVFKNLAFWFLIIIYLELVYRLSMVLSFSMEIIINVVLYSLMLSAILSIISRIFKEKANNWITAIILLVLGVLFSVQCVFTKILTTNFSLSNLALGDQAAGFIDDAIKRNMCKYCVYYLFPIAIYILSRYQKKTKYKKKYYGKLYNLCSYIFNISTIILYSYVFYKR